jgi:thiamine pyrophosphate-dependent acetolactate synthase large subunit-like protein
MPVANTVIAKGLVPLDHPLALGTLGPYSTPACSEFFAQTDVLLVVGTTLGQFSTGDFGYRMIPRQARIIQIDVEPTEIGRIYPISVGIEGDARKALAQLSRALADLGIDRRPLDAHPGTQVLLNLKSAWSTETLSLRTSDKLPIQRWRLLHELRQALPRDAQVGGQSGGPSIWFEHAFEALTHAEFVGGWHVLGAEYCEALGAKVAAPEKTIVCLTGDGSMMMSIQELATAVQYGLAVVCVVCHNGYYGNERHSQMVRYGERYIGTTLPIPDLAQVAREFGAYAERVERPDEIGPAIHRALESGRPTLLDVIVDTNVENLVPPRSLRGTPAGTVAP